MPGQRDGFVNVTMQRTSNKKLTRIPSLKVITVSFKSVSAE